MPQRKAATAGNPAQHKRQLSASTIPTETTPGSRASKRVKASGRENSTGKTAPKKSKYFENPGTEDDEDVQVPGSEVSDSGYEDEDASLTEPSESESEDEYNSEEEDRRKKKKGRSVKSAKQAGDAVTAVLEAGKELWRQGVKAGLGPGKQVFIEKPKPRGDGGIPHSPERIHPNTMAFLADLKKNNDREWLKSKIVDILTRRSTEQRAWLIKYAVHDPDYRQSWKDWESFVETLTEKIAEVDETIPELPPKDLV